jgi:ABC-type polysaccharide/polyol phosphate export permease
LVSRTLWLILSQFLLLLCYFLIDENKLPRRSNLNYFKLVGIIGMFSTTFIYAAILAAELEFVELRTLVTQISVDHPDLPLRTLPNIGIGGGLLCPIFLALLSLYFWILLTAKNNTAAMLTVLSGALFAVFVVGEAHEVPSGSIAALLIGASLPMAVVLLAVAVFVGIRWHRKPS